jgi:hypothetical protein
MSTSLAVVISVCVITCVGLPLLGLVLRFGLLPVVVAARSPTPQADAVLQRVEALERLLEERWLHPSPFELPLGALATRARS